MKTAKVIQWILIAFGIALLVCVGLYFSKTPQAERDWADRFQKLNTAEIHENGSVTLYNVRDWTYEGDTIVSKDWTDAVTVDPSTITNVWFLLEPFPSWDRVGHTYLTFEFNDGTALSFSVEAKMERTESYSGIKGLFRNYELAYTWGTERDFLTRRIDYLDHEVYMYPLVLEDTTGPTIFMALVNATNELSEKPQFYNTLTANCTNILAQIVNEKYGDRLPYDISWNLPGTSDEFLLEQGFIAGDAIANAREQHQTHQYRSVLSAFNDFDSKLFSVALREMLQHTGK